MTTSKLARVLVISTVLAALSLGGTAYARRARTRRPRATSPSPPPAHAGPAAHAEA
jgi:hypothetical protein